MSIGPFAKVVPYSSVVGGGVTLHGDIACREPAFAQLALLNISPTPGEDHRQATERVAKMLADIINKYGAGL